MKHILRSYTKWTDSAQEMQKCWLFFITDLSNKPQYELSEFHILNILQEHFFAVCCLFASHDWSHLHREQRYKYQCAAQDTPSGDQGDDTWLVTAERLSSHSTKSSFAFLYRIWDLSMVSEFLYSNSDLRFNSDAQNHSLCSFSVKLVI
jgi:hypothetical protein